MRIGRRWRIAVGLVLGVVALFAVWLAWLAYQVNEDVSAAVDDARELQQAALDDDRAAQRRALDDLRAHSGSAADRTSGLSWSIASHLPVVGDDARGVRVAAQVVADLGENGVQPLLQVTDELGSLLPRDASISTDSLVAMQDPVAAGEAAFADADRRLAAEDSSGYVARLREKYRELVDRVEDAHQVLAAADRALAVMPTMLGADGPRHYLLVFQNNAEIRSTGGLPGAVSLVSADGGKVKMDRQVAANTFGERDTPVLPLTPAERQIYGEQLGTYFLDANFTPDFPRTAELMRARWQEVYPDRVDGVISLDPVALSYILEAVGPVDVDGVQLAADNAVDVLLSETYADRPDPAAQDAFFRQVARAIFDRVSQGADDPIGLAEALSRAADEHRLYVHSFHDEEQAELDGTAVAGELTYGDPASPQVGVFLNDGTGSKMSYYLRYRVNVDSTFCAEGVQGVNGSMRLTSTAPEDAARSLPDYVTGGGAFGTEPGRQLVYVRLYGPVDGSISDVDLNSKPATDLQVILQDGRPVTTVPVELAPGETIDLSWRMRAEGQDGDVRVSVTPSVQPGDSSSTALSSCG